MKIRQFLYLFLVLLTGQALFSCTSSKLVAVRNESADQYLVEEAGEGSMAQSRTKISRFDNTDAVYDEVLEASASNDMNLPPAEHPVTRRTADITPSTKTTPATATPSVREIIKAVKEQAKSQKATRKEFKQQYTKAERKEMRRSIKAKLQDSNTQILAIILAILIPPIGVLVYEGELTTRFWIALLLTLLFYFPGMIYALLVVTGTI